METLARLFDINQVFFTVWSYQMSYLEFFGTVFTIWCVVLTARAKVLSWPIGIIGTGLYMFLFYQIQLYSDLLEQIYFLVTGIWGWWAWRHPKTLADRTEKNELRVSTNTAKQNVVYVGVIALGTLVLAYATSNLHLWLPVYFSEPASFPFLDAFTTVMSFVAQWLLVRKKVESWILWIGVDAIAIWLYWSKGVKFVSIEYVLFFFIAIWGLTRWIREHGTQNKNYDKEPSDKI